MAASKSQDKDAVQEMAYGASNVKLLIQEARMKLDLFFIKDVWIFEELENVMTFYWYDDLEVSTMRETLLRRMEQKKDINDPAFRDEFRSKTLTQFRKLLFSEKMDGLSRLGAMDPFMKTSFVNDSFNERNPVFFLKNFEFWGFGVITGKPGTGKTNFACTLMDMASTYHNLKKPDVKFRIITNVMIVGDLPEGIQYTTSFKELLILTIQNTLDGYKTIAFLDEMPQFFNKKRAMSGNYLSFEKVLFLLRKFGGNLMAIVQREEDIPTVMKDFSENFYQKINHKTLLFNRGKPGGRGMDMFVIGDIPNTVLNYDTTDIAAFEIDVNIEELQKYIASLGSMRDMKAQLVAIKDWLQNANLGVKDKDDEKGCIRYLHDTVGMKNQEIANLTGVATSTVSSITRTKNYK